MHTIKIKLKKLLSSVFIAIFLLFLSPLITSSAPEMTEYGLPADDYSLFSLSKGTDGSVWYSLRNTGNLVKVSPNGQYTEYPVPSSIINETYRFFMGGIDGPDGNMWFASTQYNENDPEQHFIHKVTVQGVVTTYPFIIPDVAENVGCGRGISDMAFGSDGNIWIVGGDDDAGCKGLIAKVDTSGNLIDFYYVETLNNIIQGVAGPDGNMWFVSPGSVGKITPGGVSTIYPIQSTAIAIVAGPDGNMWFSSIIGVQGGGTNGAISKITPNGTISEYPVGQDFSYSVTLGSDNNIWFSSANNAVGRMDIQGNYELYTLPSPNTLSLGVVSGPDGNIWIMSWNPTLDSYTLVRAIPDSTDPNPPEPEIPVVTPPLISVAKPPKSGDLAIIVLITSVLIGLLGLVIIATKRNSAIKNQQNTK